MYIPGNLDWEKLGNRDPLVSRPLLAVSYAAVVLLALLAPNDILSQSMGLADGVRAIGHIVPSIDGWTQTSQFPEVTALFFAVCWVLAPIQAILAYSMPTLHRQLVEHWQAKRVVRLTLPFVTLLIVPAYLWLALVWGWESPDCVGLCIGKSRAVLGFLGGAIPIGAAFACVVTLVWVRRFREIYSRSAK